MTVMELGALGEFLGVFALVATLIYLSIQVRYARSESEKAVLEARTTGVRELAMSVATSEGLSAALVKAWEAIGEAPGPFVAELISHGLDRQEADRVRRWYFATWRLNATQYESSNQKHRNDFDLPLQDAYSSGVGRLFWDNFPVIYPGFSAHVNQLIAEADQQQETQQ